MSEYLSLHDAEQIAAENAPVEKPGLGRVFIGMLRDPTGTLARALEHPIQSYAILFAAAGGIYWALNMAVAQAPGRTMSLPAILAAVVVLGLAGGVGYLFALTIIINWACDILGGAASRRQIRMLLAYVGVPGLLALALFGVPRLLLLGPSLFAPERQWLASPVVWGLWFGDAICFAWSLMLVVKGLKMMNGFGTGRAVLAAALPLIPILLIGGLFIFIAWTGLLVAPPAF